MEWPPGSPVIPTWFRCCPIRSSKSWDSALELRSRQVRSYTPVDASGLLIERQEGRTTRDSFRALTGNEREYQAWSAFEAGLQELAAVIEPTLTEPLPRVSALRARVDQEFWASMVERPLGQLIETRFADDSVRGVVLTDAMIGTLPSAHDPSLRQNRCFLYHMIGNGNGEWRVPVGGMGTVTAELVRVAQEAGVSIRRAARLMPSSHLPTAEQHFRSRRARR